MSDPRERLINPRKYQVFLMSSPASLPIAFASHPWFIVNKKGSVSRWGVWWRPEEYHATTLWGHLAKDVLPPFQGLRVNYFSNRFHWKSSLLKVIEGDEGSLAARMSNFIEQSPQTYPYKDRYSFFGPNSNTYAQWVINHFPEAEMRLPWNSLGKRAVRT